MTVNNIMSHGVVTIEFEDDLYVVRARFEEYGFHHLLVTENSKLIGVISDRDLLRAISPYVDTPAETTHDAATMNKRAHQIMTRHPITIDADTEILDAIALFNQTGVSCLPVVDNQFKPIGIITWRDILKTVEVISRKKRETRH